ncbi:glycerophosphodiester phosphodiesterase family protein [Vibrio sp. PP-XX7]
MTQTTIPFNFSRNNPKTMIVAHRGIWERAPENSILAIEHAIQAGIDIVEIDTQKCATGEFVVIHDETLDRTTNGRGLVAQTTLEQIKTLRLRQRDGGASNTLSDQTLPLLSDLLKHAQGKIMVNIDAKTQKTYPKSFRKWKDFTCKTSPLLNQDTTHQIIRCGIRLTTTVRHMPMLCSQKIN